MWAILSERKHLTMEDWLWRYRWKPGSDPALILVAENAGRLVGCLHRSHINLYLGQGIVVPAVLEGDLYVLPEYRRQHLGAELMRSPSFGGAFLTYGFTSPEVLDRFHSNLGLVEVPWQGVRYRKLLRIEPLLSALSGSELPLKAGKSGLPEGKPLTIQVCPDRLPPFFLKLQGKTILGQLGRADAADLTVSGDLGFLRRPRLGSLLPLLWRFLTGRLRIRGSVMALFRLVSLLRSAEGRELRWSRKPESARANSESGRPG